MNMHPFTFRVVKRVRFAEVDGQRLLYHGRYLEYLDRGIQEYWRWCGLFATVDLDNDPMFHVGHAEVDYIRPIRLDERIDIWTRIDRIGVSSVHFQFALHGHDADDLRATGREVHVHVDPATSRSSPIGEEIRALVEAKRGVSGSA